MDPSLNGRVPIWREYWQLWGLSPGSGLGFQGIQAQVPDLTGLAQDAHNVVLDSLVRYGVVPAFFGTAFLVLAGFVVLSVGFRDQGFPVAVYVTSMACFMTYTTFGWSYMTVFLWPFMLAVFLAAEDRAPRNDQPQFVARPPERTSQ
jgi:O-antigen ligase